MVKYLMLVLLVASYTLLQATFTKTNFTSSKNSQRLFQDNLCSPRNGISVVEHLFPFLIKRWIAARDEITLSSNFEDDAFKMKLNSAVKRFNFLTHKIQLFNLNDTLVGYVTIWKCIIIFLILITIFIGASESIRKNLLKMIPTSSKANFYTTIRNQSQPIPQNFMSTFRNPPSNLTIFTFVRDPFQHFESGLAQAGESTAFHNKKFNNVLDWKLNSTDEIKYYLNKLLDFNIAFNESSDMRLNALVHIYPMAGVLMDHDFDFIGRLETFQSDWNETIVPQYNLSIPFNLAEGLHASAINHPSRIPVSPNASSSRIDPQNVRLYYRLLLKQEPSYARAMCNLVLVDYVCLPSYKLPRECEFLHDARSEGVNILTSVHSHSRSSSIDFQVLRKHG